MDSISTETTIAPGRYIGTKIIEVLGMETEKPGVENPRQGVKVRYPDGYESWSPLSAFLAAYRPVLAMSFGLAIEAMKKGAKVARVDWNGKGMFLFLVAGSQFKVNRPPLLGIYPEGTEITYGTHIDIKAVDGSVRPWVASQSDMLADDWMLVE
jgi:hypothetical protein